MFILIIALRTSFRKQFVTRSTRHKGFRNISRTHQVACFVLLEASLESALKLAVSNSSLASFKKGLPPSLAAATFAGFEHWARQMDSADPMAPTSTTMTPTTTTTTTTCHHQYNYIHYTTALLIPRPPAAAAAAAEDQTSKPEAATPARIRTLSRTLSMTKVKLSRPPTIVLSLTHMVRCRASKAPNGLDGNDQTFLPMRADPAAQQRGANIEANR